MLSKRRNLVALPAPERLPLLRCPRCSSTLRAVPAYLSCSECSYQLPVIDGIISATANSTYYRHQLPADAIEKFLSQSEHLGWVRSFYALQRSRPRDRQRLFEQAAEPSRAGWKYVLPLPEAAKVLVLGIGSEAIPISFASPAATVIAVDACRQRLESLRFQIKARRIDSISLIHGSDVEMLPLCEQFFDAVIIPDLQDWLPQLSGDRVRQIPLEFLRAVKRLIKPRGVLYVAGENRFTYSGLFQNRAESQDVWEVEARHGFIGSASGRAAAIDQPWTGVPKKRGRRSSTSSHSYRGYQRRLREAGMFPREVYSPVPDHRSPTEVVELTTRNPAAAAPSLGISSLLKSRIRSNPHFLRAFGHSYALVSSPEERGEPSFLEVLFAELSQALNAEDIELENYAIGETEVAIQCTLFGLSTRSADAGAAAQRREQPALIRIPYGRYEALGALRGARALVRLRELKLEPALRAVIPKLLFCGEVRGQRVVVESRLRGEPVAELFGEWPRSRTCLTIEELAQLLGRVECPSRALWRQAGSKRFVQMCNEISSALIDPSVRRWFERLCGALNEKLNAAQLPSVLAHGDLHTGSIIVDPQQGKLRQILDWHAMTEYGLPGWDLIGCENSVVRQSRQCSLGESVVWLLENGYAQGFMPVWRAYERENGSCESVRSALILSHWVRAVWQKFRQPLAPLNYEWVRSNVIAVLEKVDRV